MLAEAVPLAVPPPDALAEAEKGPVALMLW